MPTTNESIDEHSTIRNKTWRLVTSDPGSAAWNMGVDEALMEQLNRGGNPVLRFYTWERPTVSLGYFQKPLEELDLDGLKQIRGEWVHRPTGGRAVLHDDELTYAVVIREEDLPGNVVETYRVLSQALVQGLCNLGVPAAMARDTLPLTSGSAACFDAPSWYEVVAEGRKLIGSAQVRRNGVILQHGSIPITFSVERLLNCLRFSQPRLRERTGRILQTKAGALSDFLPQRPELGAIMQACQQGFTQVHNIEFVTEDLKPGECQRAKELAVSKYQHRRG